MRFSQPSGDMYRWNEFPGLEEAVKQVNAIDWSGLQAAPGGPVKFNMPKFDDDSSLSNTLEEGEIKDESEIDMKEEAEDEPGLSLDAGQPERHPPPEMLQPQPQQYGNPCGPDSGDSGPSGSPTPSMAQSPVPHPAHQPIYWHELPHLYGQRSFPLSYPFMPYYNIGLPSYGPESLFPRGNYPQSPYSAGHPQLHASPQPLVGPTHPGVPLLASLPSRSRSPPGLETSSSNSHKEPSPDTKSPSVPPLDSTISEPPGSQQRDNRKLPISTETSTSVSSRPLKRRRPVASDFMSDDDEPPYNRTKHKPLESGPRDFGTWFQQQVVGRKKRLCHLEHTSVPIATKSDS